MAVQHHVRNPIEWGWDRLKDTGHAIGSAASTMDGAWDTHGTAPPVVRKIGLGDLRQALSEGARDFGACRTDVVFLCMIYPIAGLITSRFAFDYGLLPLIFPLVSGFALIAPLFGVGQRAFFLHDGRALDLVTAIEDHASSGSEANTVISSFNALPAATQQNIINFLRSL